MVLDEMHVRSPFLKGILTKIIISVIKKNLGDFDTKLTINDLDVMTNENRVNLKLNIEVDANRDIIKALTSKIF